jgi:uncharacterized protein with WD repeat
MRGALENGPVRNREKRERRECGFGGKRFCLRRRTPQRLSPQEKERGRERKRERRRSNHTCYSDEFRDVRESVRARERRREKE